MPKTGDGDVEELECQPWVKLLGRLNHSDHLSTSSPSSTLTITSVAQISPPSPFAPFYSLVHSLLPSPLSSPLREKDRFAHFTTNLQKRPDNVNGTRGEGERGRGADGW